MVGELHSNSHNELRGRGDQIQSLQLSPSYLHSIVLVRTSGLNRGQEDLVLVLWSNNLSFAIRNQLPLIFSQRTQYWQCLFQSVFPMHL